MDLKGQSGFSFVSFSHEEAKEHV